ncbi:MAG: Gfo/Idh/MocA family oxidoreductase [Pelagibacteraceae bacterium]|nr:Gfo/Idh/MocA family oxidoreductase [Pelagibacteraceae bacterium]
MKIGIIGTGNISHKHFKEFSKIEGVKIESVCDVNNENLNLFISKFGKHIRCYSSADEMLENEKNFDGISNATPDKFHKEVSLKVLNRQLNIFSEKPLAENYQDAKILADAANKYNVINMVNFTYRESSAYQKLVEILKSHQLGDVRHVSANYYQSWLTSNIWGKWREEDSWLWRLSKEHGSNGALGDTGVHIFDFTVNAVGDIKELCADLKTFKEKGTKIGKYTLDANDGFTSMIRFENGAIGTVTNTRYATGYANTLILEVFCEKGAVKVELDEQRNKWSTLNICEGDNIHSIKWEKIECDQTPSNFERFISSIRKNSNDQPNFTQGAKIQKILDMCIKSNDINQWVDIK